MVGLPNALREPSLRGVSPVIGVVLMVAITVILAAVVGTFVMEMAGNIETTARAGVAFHQPNATAVDVTLMTLGNLAAPGDLSFVEPCSGEPGSFNAVGDTVTVTGCTGGDRITVLGEVAGNRNVIATYTVR